jgi:hypothetical protein
MKQLGLALNMYLADCNDTMPWPNWGNDNSPPCPQGWAYASNPNTPTNLMITTAASWDVGRVANLKTGVYWQYLPNANTFMCPADMRNVGTAAWLNRYQKLSTYVMNGASAYYPPYLGQSGQPGLYAYATCKVTQIWNPLCWIQWEPDPVTGNAYNDGGNYPDPNEGVSHIHKKGANVLAVSGNATYMSYSEFMAAEADPPVTNPRQNRKGLFWWNPNQSDGHGTQE